MFRRLALIATVVAVLCAVLAATWFFGPAGGRGKLECRGHREALHAYFAPLTRAGEVHSGLDERQCDPSRRAGRVMVSVELRDATAVTLDELGRTWRAADADARFAAVASEIGVEATTGHLRLHLHDPSLLTGQVADALAQSAAAGVDIVWDQSLASEPEGLAEPPKDATRHGRLRATVDVDPSAPDASARLGAAWQHLSRVSDQVGWAGLLVVRTSPDDKTGARLELPLNGGQRSPEGLVDLVAAMHRLAQGHGSSLIVEARHNGLSVHELDAAVDQPRWTAEQVAELRRIRGVLAGWGYRVAPA